MSFTPHTPPSTGTYTRNTTNRRQIRYGDAPRLDGSVMYGEYVVDAGQFTPRTTSTGSFTPST